MRHGHGQPHAETRAVRRQAEPTGCVQTSIIGNIAFVKHHVAVVCGLRVVTKAAPQRLLLFRCATPS